MMGGSMRRVRAWMAGAEFSGEPNVVKPADLDALLGTGRVVYERNCVPCHGVEGRGRGPEADRLNVPPADFTRGTYKFRSTPTGTLPLTRDLFRTISRGVHGTSMLPWVSLNERERWAVARRLERFSARFEKGERGDPVPVPDPPAFTDSLIARGEALFRELKCVDCHGPEGRGNGPRSDELTDSKGRPIRPRDYTTGRFKAGSGARDIYRTVVTGLDGTPMPAFHFDPQYVWPVVAYVKSLVREPARGPRGGMMGGMGRNGHPEEQKGLRIDMHRLMHGMGGMMR